jgi:Xaa-Pro aminopeptidase
VNLELPPMDVAGRVDRLRAALPTAGPDGSPIAALVVTELANVRYLTGFTGSAAVVVVHGDGLLFVSDGRYAEQSAEQLAAAGVEARIEISNQGQREVVSGVVAEWGADVVGLEAEHVSWAQQQAFAGDWFAGRSVVPTKGVVEDLREVKDDGEVARIGAAAAIADAALASIRPLLGERVRERDFALELDTAMRREGAEGPSFETIVASGPNAAMPHHRPGARLIRPAEPVVIDFGARFDGYCSDMTRTVWLDAVTDPDLRRAVDVVLESQAAGVAAVRAGVPAAEVDGACRQVIAAAGWADFFVHGTGHGVGLDIHEAPSVAATSTDTLEAGHVVTVEPGVYLPGLGGVRIEDTVVVTADGCRPLTSTPKDLL